MPERPTPQIVVPSTNFKLLNGSPKEISKTADSGKSITNCFCADCGMASLASFPLPLLDFFHPYLFWLS
jgi:hypothetical protein